MKALSVKQPWASLIAQGKKTIETRSWPTDYRGELLIVSSRFPAIEPAGCAVAVVNLVDCRPMTRADEAAACCEIYPGAWAWVLEEVRAVKPWPVRGQLRIFEVEVPDLRRALVAEIKKKLTRNSERRTQS
jgi:hypothetical protein